MSVAVALPLPGRGRLDVARIGPAGAGGLSLPGQEGLTRAGVGESVLSCHLLQGHTLEEMEGTSGGRVCEDKLHYPQCQRPLKLAAPNL